MSTDFFTETKKIVARRCKVSLAISGEVCYTTEDFGGLAQLVRASASHAEGRRFESAALHQQKSLFCLRTKETFLNDVFHCVERDVLISVMFACGE